MDLPAITPMPSEQLDSTAGTEILDQLVELLRLSGMLATARLKERAMLPATKHRAGHGRQADSARSGLGATRQYPCCS